MIPLYEHQKIILKEDKLWVGIFQGTGSGKTRSALELAEGKILIVCLKQQFLDKTWERNAEKFGIIKDLNVMSKEQFKKNWEELPYYDTVIFDEAHRTFGVQPYKRQRKRVEVIDCSQQFEATLGYLNKHKPKRFYPCTATPSSKAMKVWAIAKLFGTHWNFEKFRETFYISRGGYWFQKKDEETQHRLALLVQRFGYTGALEDFVDVPKQTHKEVYFDLTKKQKDAIKELKEEEADPMIQRGRTRSIQNGILYVQDIQDINERESKMVRATNTFPSQKLDYIVEKASEFKKILIFAYYTGQIQEIKRVLDKEGYIVSTLTGQTKDKDKSTMLLKANDSDRHIVIAQIGISAGYELPSFRCVIYASKSYQYDHYKQSLGRLVRANNLHKNLYIHLLVKGPDADCHESMMIGEDFQEKLSPL